MTLKLNGTNSVAAPAYAGDDADTGLQCGTDELKLVTGGTARATVDSSGDVMIGTTSNTAHSDADNLIVGSTGGTHQGMTINGSTSSQIRFADSGSNTAGYIIYSHSANSLQFATNGTERMRILSDGTIRLASGCPGIDFSQIQTNNSGMTSETLDSYEEGTWTAGLLSKTSPSGSITFTGNTGTYIKIGKMCFISIFLKWSASSLGGSNLQLTGLPFTQQTNDNRRGGFLITYRSNALTGLSNVHDLTVRTETNQTNARFQYGNGDGNATTELVGSDIKNANAAMMITGTYEVA
jgi:hypothetical protein